MKRMNVKMRRWSWVVAALLLLVWTGCTDHNLEGREDLKPGKYITVTAEIADMVATYGTPINSASQMTDFGFFCSYTGTNQWNASTHIPNKMYNVKMVRNATTGFWDYAGTPVEWDNASAADNYTFFAYAPFATGANGNGLTVLSAATDPGIPQLSYTVPNTVENQPDLMVATARKNIHATGHPVNMQMKHALTAIGFEMSGDGETVVGIDISGVSTTGKLTMDAAAGISWTNLNSPTNTAFSVGLNGGSYVLTSTPTNPLATDGYLMMVPQALTSTAKVKVTFNDGTNKVMELSSASPVWEAGKRVIYSISLGDGPGGPGGPGTGSGGISVKQESVWINHQAQTTAIEVECKKDNGSPDPTATWSLESSDPWLTLSLNANGSGASSTVNGTGSQTVYLIATQNNSTILPRTAIISLNGKTFATNVVQSIDDNQITGAGEVLGMTPYVGAFWRHDQIGERIIKINVGNNYDGPWTATLTWLDSKWNPLAGDAVLLALGGSHDPGVTWAVGENPGNAESFPVTDGAYSISGNVGKNQDIIFRIGLQKPFTAYNELSNPARYAVIVLTYTYFTETRKQKIFLRQGEGADYIMTTNDPVTHQTVPSGVRTKITKFSPYNLTAATLNAQVGINGAGPNPGVFTDFPTQAGAYFQFAKASGNARLRWAYSPANYSAAESGWDNTTYPDNTHYWHSTLNPLATENETCPAGYRRPNDYDTNVAVPSNNGDVSKSEIRQSLWWKPQYANASNLENSEWGYYADGFFDRRRITGQTGAAGISTVASGTKDVAYMGRLFFSPHTAHLKNQSVFFPAAGIKRNTDGWLQYAGTQAFYHTTAVHNAGQGYMFAIHAAYDQLTPSNIKAMIYVPGSPVSLYRNTGYSIRCVRDN